METTNDLEKNCFAFIKELEQYNYEIKSIDHIWNIIFPNKKEKWRHIQVTKYKETYYVSLLDDNLVTLEIIPKKSVQLQESFTRSSSRYQSANPIATWMSIIKDVFHWFKIVNKSWLKANRKVQEEYPLNRRSGIVPHSIIRALLPDIYRVDRVLGKSKTKKFIQIVEDGYFYNEKNTIRKSMTANNFFEYCKIAYLAAQEKSNSIDPHLSGKEMYKIYADGRHEGLLDINLDSEKEFAEWLDGKHPKKTSGGHPWEIKRGGNTTHIDLYVSRPSYYLKEGFKLTLSGPSSSRLAETVSMFLALHEAKLPISISDPERVYKRLLALDNIGIVPCFQSLHRANQDYTEEQCVSDVIHYDDLGRYKTQIKPFITWEILPMLRPRSI